MMVKFYIDDIVGCVKNKDEKEKHLFWLLESLGASQVEVFK